MVVVLGDVGGDGGLRENRRPRGGGPFCFAAFPVMNWQFTLRGSLAFALIWGGKYANHRGSDRRQCRGWRSLCRRSVLLGPMSQ